MKRSSLDKGPRVLSLLPSPTPANILLISFFWYLLITSQNKKRNLSCLSSTAPMEVLLGPVTLPSLKRKVKVRARFPSSL